MWNWRYVFLLYLKRYAAGGEAGDCEVKFILRTFIFQKAIPTSAIAAEDIDKTKSDLNLSRFFEHPDNSSNQSF
jgi:hypothetical protein